MSEQLQLRLVTPVEAVLDESVDEVTGPGTVGEFGVLPNHAAFLSALEIGRPSYKSAGTTRHVAVRGGFAEVADNVVTVVVDAAQPAEQIDTSVAQSDLEAARSRLADLSPSEPEYAPADADLRWAEVRLDVAKLR